MEKRTKKMLLAILMIITVLGADFFLLGSEIITYATELSNETNNDNVEFSVYFKEDENKVDSIQKSIKDENVRLFAEVKVKNEGYLKEGTVIELENSNFNLKNNILPSNTHIKTIEGNKVTLKQISAGETIELELDIEPIIGDKLTIDFLSKTTTIKIIGSYVYSKEDEGQLIATEKIVSINYQPDDTFEAELETDIITNKVIAVNGNNKRIVQALIKSKLANNDYPVQQTKLTTTIPVLDEAETEPEISTFAIGKLATNGTTEISNTTTENGLVQITLNNEKDENDQISWDKGICDEIVVTYIYPETVDASKIEITTDSEMKLYNSEKTYTKQSTKTLENQEPNNVIMGKAEITTEEIYKGSIYANLETKYNTKTSINITNSEIVEEIVVSEGPDTFSTADDEIEANTKYISTEINLEKALLILGQDGNIEIKNGEETTVINKETQTNEDGNVIINYEKESAEIQITTSKPVAQGTLELNHIKAIKENTSYTRAQLQQTKTIKTNGQVEGNITVNKEKQKVVSNTMKSNELELKETKTKAEISIENNKTTLSTTEANEVTLGISLITDGLQYDLFKNPKLNIKFPSAVENVELISNLNEQNASEFTVDVGEFDTKNKTLLVDLQGEQTKYPESELTQGYIQLNLKITLNTLALAQTDKIMMAYTNENATQYENEVNGVGIAEETVQISAPSQLVKMFNLSTNTNTSFTEQIMQTVKENEAGKNIDFGITLINNKDSDMNLKILGKLPTTGVTISEQKENTLETTLKAIKAENAEIYFTENAKATQDIEDAENGWTQDLATLTNAKLYLIKVDSLERGAKFDATITVQLPKTIVGNAISYTQYGVIYSTETETDVKESSRKIGLATSVAANIRTEVTAQVGKDKINDGDIVKEGEVIKYTVTVTNNGTATLENVQLKLNVPEGTTYVRPIEKYIFGEGTEYEDIIEPGGFVYANGYYEEIKDIEKLNELTTLNIAQLTTTKTYSVEYEVRVNKGTANTEISNKPDIIYGDSEIESTELKNMIQEANVRVTIKRHNDIGNQIYPGGTTYYRVYVENLSDETIENLKVQILSDEIKVGKIHDDQDEEVKDGIVINQLEAKGMVSYRIEALIKESASEINICAKVNDSNENTYRSNLVKESLPHIEATIDMSSPQDGMYIKEGEPIEYNIKVKNTGSIRETIQVNSAVDQFLTIQAMYVNGIEKNINMINDKIYHEIELEVGEEAQIKIVAKSEFISSIYHGNVINTTADVLAFGILQDSSKMVSHVLIANNLQNENLENMISGYAWFDENENGKRDTSEDVLPGIKVKLYDLAINDYVEDEDRNTLYVETQQDGRYTFTNIKQGSYLIVFEYDTKIYALTTPLAQNVDSSLNSKASIKTIIGEEYKTRFAAIEVKDLKQNELKMNIGLIENPGDIPIEEQPGIEEIPKEPQKPQTPQNPGSSQKPEEIEKTKSISGYAWLDLNVNGNKDKEEKYLSGIKVRLYNVNRKKYITNEIITDDEGKYQFNDIEKGLYIVIFEYNTEEYKFTSQDSKLVLKKLNINGQERTVAVTETIDVQNNVSDINIGLRENAKFDLELNKYISKIILQTNKETKTYEYEGKTLGKVEIHRKQVQGALVVLEYTIQIKNTGEIAGYAKNIVDYIPNGLTFSSELNTDWYLSGNNLYTKSLENVAINPGEQKEVKLILTKTMTNNNVGLVNNRAEIYQDYNLYGEPDIDSTPNNQNQNEDDFGMTDVIIQVATGGSIATYTILGIINIVLIYVAIKIMINNGIIEIESKEKGGRNI